MEELNALLKPSWGAEKWIHEGWKHLTSEEKELVQSRMDDLFKEGLPFKLEHDKLFYIYAFSLLAQLEVLAIQVPLKFEAQLTSPIYKERMRTQLLDEIFHGLVFTKIVYLLCAPYALPPVYNDEVEVLCNFIRQEDCPKVGVVLLNLISEGWIEELFTSFQQQGIAPKVFEVILGDEHRHVCEAELYRDIGFPDKEEVRAKLEYLEEQLLTNLFSQYKYAYSVSRLLGVDGARQFMQSLHQKHVEQLKKIQLVPSEKWNFFMEMAGQVFPSIEAYNQSTYNVEMTPIRKVFMTQWSDPSDPTMAGEFNINVSPLDFFNKKYPPETVTTLMLQTISHALSTEDSFRNFLSHKKLYQSKESYVALVVKLPGCGDHVGNIVFENCHRMGVPVLSLRIRQILQVMVHCYQQRESLEKQHPHLKCLFDDDFYEFFYGAYGYPLMANPFTTLSNIGFCGYTQAKSPLRVNEGLKFTLFEIEKRLVWNKTTQAFEAQDMLPVSVSADHRIFDGNLPIPKLMMKSFAQAFETMLATGEAKMPPAVFQADEIFGLLNELVEKNLELGYKVLSFLQTAWADFIPLGEIFVRMKAYRRSL